MRAQQALRALRVLRGKAAGEALIATQRPRDAEGWSPACFGAVHLGCVVKEEKARGDALRALQRRVHGESDRVDPWLQAERRKLSRRRPQRLTVVAARADGLPIGTSLGATLVQIRREEAFHTRRVRSPASRVATVGRVEPSVGVPVRGHGRPVRRVVAVKHIGSRLWRAPCAARVRRPRRRGRRVELSAAVPGHSTVGRSAPSFEVSGVVKSAATLQIGRRRLPLQSRLGGGAAATGAAAAAARRRLGCRVTPPTAP